MKILVLTMTIEHVSHHAFVNEAHLLIKIDGSFIKAKDMKVHAVEV